MNSSQIYLNTVLQELLTAMVNSPPSSIHSMSKVQKNREIRCCWMSGFCCQCYPARKNVAFPCSVCLSLYIYMVCALKAVTAHPCDASVEASAALPTNSSKVGFFHTLNLPLPTSLGRNTPVSNKMESLAVTGTDRWRLFSLREDATAWIKSPESIWQLIQLQTGL